MGQENSKRKLSDSRMAADLNAKGPGEFISPEPLSEESQDLPLHLAVPLDQQPGLGRSSCQLALTHTSQ